MRLIHIHRPDTHMDTVNVHVDNTVFYRRPSQYAYTPVIPISSGILDKGQLYTNTLRVKPLCVFLVTLSLDYGCTTSNSQRSSNIFHVIKDTMRSLYPERERETVMSLSEGFPPAVAVCLSAPVSPSGCFGRGEEGRREKGMSVHPVSLRVSVCVLSQKGKKGDWPLFENSNQPIIVVG